MFKDDRLIGAVGDHSAARRPGVAWISFMRTRRQGLVVDPFRLASRRSSSLTGRIHEREAAADPPRLGCLPDACDQHDDGPAQGTMEYGGQTPTAGALSPVRRTAGACQTPKPTLRPAKPRDISIGTQPYRMVKSRQGSRVEALLKEHLIVAEN